MRLIAFEQACSSRLGLRVDEEVVDLTGLGYPTTLDELLLQGADAMTSARGAATRAAARLPLSGIRYLPPLANPSKAIAVGLNYVDHAAESPYKDPPKYPILFHRFRSSWVAHGEPLVRPHVSTAFDYEGEMVVVIGKAGRYIDKAQALAHVAGYSIFNEGSIRDYQLRTTQWTIGKNFDKSGGFGPELVTADELPPGAVGLRLSTRLNGETLQDASTKDMIFDVATLIAACSEAMALQPGDLIISGTPAGVGFARKPPIFMKPGDVCEVEIEGIGLLRNGIVDETR
jgi:2-keto-4-pentenoate hydratase/2-oxohepta-3-ene-1,7-dioic acid hydratase in catechol pathway